MPQQQLDRTAGDLALLCCCCRQLVAFCGGGEQLVGRATYYVKRCGDRASCVALVSCGPVPWFLQRAATAVQYTRYEFCDNRLLCISGTCESIIRKSIHHVYTMYTRVLVVSTTLDRNVNSG